MLLMVFPGKGVGLGFSFSSAGPSALSTGGVSDARWRISFVVKMRVFEKLAPSSLVKSRLGRLRFIRKNASIGPGAFKNTCFLTALLKYAKYAGKRIFYAFLR